MGVHPEGESGSDVGSSVGFQRSFCRESSLLCDVAYDGDEDGRGLRSSTFQST